MFHSIVWQYLSPTTRRELDLALGDAARRASAESPLAYLRFEPAGDHAETWLRTWPGGDDRLVARAGFHGAPLELVA